MEKIEGTAVYDDGRDRGYSLAYRCPSDGTVTIYFDYLVHKIDSDCFAQMQIRNGQYGETLFSDYDKRFDNKNFRFNPKFNVFKGQQISHYIAITLHNATPSKPWTCSLSFSDE